MRLFSPFSKVAKAHSLRGRKELRSAGILPAFYFS